MPRLNVESVAHVIADAEVVAGEEQLTLASIAALVTDSGRVGTSVNEASALADSRASKISACWFLN